MWYFLILYACFIMLMSNDSDCDDADYLIVLGCKLNDDKPGETLISRIDTAVSYLKENPDCKAVLSGGITKDNTVSEAAIMYDLLIERGIEPERLVKEEQAQDTYENFLYSKELIDVNKKICFCSSDYHIFRSRLMALKNGLKVKSICCRTPLAELVIHLLLEEYFIIKNMIEK